MTHAQLRVGILALLLFAATFGLYFPSLSFQLVSYDDPVFIIDNPIIFDGFSGNAVRRTFTELHGDGKMYVPVLWLSYLLDVKLLGATADTPWGFHFTSVLLHSLNALLMFLLLFAFCKSPWRAFVFAAIWAWHPLRVESVAWVSMRKDVLSGFFALLCIGTYVWACRGGDPHTSHTATGNRPARGRYGLSFCFFVLGLLSKPMLVTIPFVLLLLDAWPLRRVGLSISAIRQAGWRLIGEKWPFWGASAAASAAVYVTQTHAIGSISLPLRLYYLPANYWFYVQKTVLPVGLHPMVERAPLPLVTFILMLGLLLAIIYWVWSRRTQQPNELIGWLIFLGMLFPVAGIVMIGVYPVADRYSYLPAIGLSMALLHFLPATTRPPWHRWLLVIRSALALGILALIAFLTARHLPSWQNDKHMFGNVARQSPGHYSAIYYQARVAIFTHGDFESANRMADQLLERRPSATLGLAMKILCLAQVQSAPEALEFGLAHYPPHDVHSYLGEYEHELAIVALLSDKLDLAKEYMDITLRRSVNEPVTQEQLHALAMLIAHKQGEPETALEHAHRIRALRHRTTLHPEDFMISYVTLWNRGYYAQALPLFHELVRTHKNRPDILNNTAWILATTPASPADPEDVVEMAKQALSEAPGHPVILDTLSVAQAHAGDFESALETAREVVDLLAASTATDAPDLLRKVNTRMALYEEGRPYRERASSIFLYAQ
jgi:tetratricopeptide (TPR) repeat protein